MGDPPLGSHKPVVPSVAVFSTERHRNFSVYPIVVALEEI
ncbi:hypothetical protein PC119_g12193 [Phytophthora cactorum]|nr:hypothetical protein PC119_g12193 [Phytophthora cactorum]